jgi:phage/plasmid-associated DNA primase
VDDLGPSMAARVMVADFRERYDGDKEDKKLYGKLEKEASGILGILCWAAAAWYASWSAGEGGITLPPRVVEQSRAFMERNDPVANWLNARGAFEVGSTVPSQLAYDSFGEWAKAEGGEVPFSQVRFALELAKKGFAKRKTERGMVWSGFRLLGAMALAERDTDDDADD